MNTTALKIVKGNPLNEAGPKNYINNRLSDEPKYGVLFKNYITTTLSRKAGRISVSYIRNYQNLIHHIDKFSKLNGAEIFTNSVNEEFLDDFILYLEAQNLKQGYIKNLVELSKSIIRKAATYGYAVDSSFDDVTIKDEEVFNVFLSMNEITRIYYYKGLTRFQEKIRDLFIIGCLTAMRYSDYSTLAAENFQGSYIVKVTKKTSKKVIVPIHDYIREIYDKYAGNLVFGYSIQHFNRYIKIICKKIGIDDPVTYSYTRGGQLHTTTKPKWSMVSSHTARRSAATILYLTQRFKTYEIMSLTGHTTEKSFFKYVKITNDDISKQISTDTFFKK
jgi:integrase